MNLEAYIQVHSTFAIVSATIFSILLGFTIWIMSQEEKVAGSAAILLGFGIFGAIISFGNSIIHLGIVTNEVVIESSIWVSGFFLMVSLISISILALFTLFDVYERRVKLDSGGGGDSFWKDLGLK